MSVCVCVCVCVLAHWPLGVCTYSVCVHAQISHLLISNPWAAYMYTNSNHGSVSQLVWSVHTLTPQATAQIKGKALCVNVGVFYSQLVKI